MRKLRKVKFYIITYEVFGRSLRIDDLLKKDIKNILELSYKNINWIDLYQRNTDYQNNKNQFK